MRAATTILYYPLLKRLGNTDWRVALVLIWGGLRGSVGLALALIVFHNQYDHAYWGGDQDVLQYPDDTFMACRDIPRDVLQMTCIVVLFTVVVNGSSMAWLINKLQLDVSATSPLDAT